MQKKRQYTVESKVKGVPNASPTAAEPRAPPADNIADRQVSPQETTNDRPFPAPSNSNERTAHQSPPPAVTRKRTPSSSSSDSDTSSCWGF